METQLSKIDFSTIPWAEEPGGVRSKSIIQCGRCFRLLELPPGFAEEEWCQKKHLGYVREGDFEVEFLNRTESFAKGNAFYILGAEKHRVIKTSKKVLLFLVEDSGDGI